MSIPPSLQTCWVWWWSELREADSKSGRRAIVLIGVASKSPPQCQSRCQCHQYQCHQWQLQVLTDYSVFTKPYECMPDWIVKGSEARQRRFEPFCPKPSRWHISFHPVYSCPFTSTNVIRCVMTRFHISRLSRHLRPIRGCYPPLSPPLSRERVGKEPVAPALHLPLAPGTTQSGATACPSRSSEAFPR